MSLTAGSKLGPYEILGSLAAGGMGAVYHARDTKLGREVALEFLAEKLTPSGERLARFERKAHLLASVDHPNVATRHPPEPEP